GRDRDAEVDERRLILHAPRRRAVVGGARQQPHDVSVAKRRHGLVERRSRIAHVAAERDQGVRHALAHDLFRKPAPTFRSHAPRLRKMATPTSLKMAAIGACGLCTVTRTEMTLGNDASTSSAMAPAAASTRRKLLAVKARVAASTMSA